MNISPHILVSKPFSWLLRWLLPLIALKNTTYTGLNNKATIHNIILYMHIYIPDRFVQWGVYSILQTSYT